MRVRLAAFDEPHLSAMAGNHAAGDSHGGGILLGLARSGVAVNANLHHQSLGQHAGADSNRFLRGVGKRLLGVHEQIEKTCSNWPWDPNT